jgi:hypothetical protein
VPAEVVAAYLALLPIVNAATAAGSHERTLLLAFVLFGCGAITPFYLARVADPKKPKRMHMVIGTVGMFVWAYSIGGWFTAIGAYKAGLAAILVTFFSLLSGLFVPTAGTK